MKKIHAAIITESLSSDRALQFVANERYGAQLLFAGVVRCFNEGHVVQGVTYHCFRPLADTLLQTLCEEAVKRFGDMACFIEHYEGRLPVGGKSVVIAVGTPHRAEAYEASRFLIDELKHQIPIWKQEHYLEGDSAWIHGRECCR